MATNGTCEAANATILTGDPIPFENTLAIKRAHNLSPRFGHTKEINNLINGSSDEAKDYAVGLFAGSIAMFCFFALWLVAILVLKFLGPKRVGFFSGRQVRIPKPPSYESTSEKEEEGDERENCEKDGEVNEEIHEQDEGDHKKEDKRDMIVNTEKDTSVGSEKDCFETVEMALHESHVREEIEPEFQDEERDTQSQREQLLQEWEEQVSKTETRLKRIRLTVLVCGFFIVVCVILFCSVGIAHIIDSLDHGRSGLHKAEDLTQEGIELIDDFIQRQNVTIEEAAELRAQVNGFCPNVREEICANNTDNTAGSCDVTDIPYGEEILAFLNSTGNYIYDGLEGLQQDLGELIEIFEKADETAESFYWAFYIALAFAVLLAILTLIICYVVILAWRKELSEGNYWYRRIRGCFLNGFVVPLFIFLVLMSWIFSMVFVIGSTAAADTCIDSPDSRLAEFLLAREENFVSVIFEYTLYIVSGCPEDGVITELFNHVQSILVFFETVFNLFAALSSSKPEEFQAICGTNATIVTALSSTLSNQVCVLGATMVDLQHFFSCPNWHPLYEVIMYQAICYDGTKGLAWVAGTQFTIVFLTMIMLTLRVAFYELVSEEDEEATEEARRKCLANCRTRFCCSRCRKEDRASAHNSIIETSDYN